MIDMLRQVFKFLLILVVFSAVAGLSAFFTLSFFIQSEESVVVPHLEGKDAISVLQLLGGLDLNTRVRGFEYDADVAKNHVIHQSPEAGRTIKKGRDVTLIISKGTPTVALPDLKGRNLPQARLILEQNGLVKGNRTAVYADDAARGRVLAQYPAPGTIVKRSESVDLLVSRGPRTPAYKMPDLEGRYLDDAVVVLDKYGLSMDAVNTLYDQSKPENTVIRQNPPPGQYIEKNRGVTLSVNRSEKGGPDAPGDAADRLFRYTLPQGYLKHHVRLEMSIYGMTITLYDELMAPGREIWTVVPEHAHAALFLYLNEELVVSEIYN